MKKITAMLLLVFTLVGCGSSLVFKKGDVITLDTPVSGRDYEIILNDMSLSGKDLKFNVTIKNHHEDDIQVDKIQFYNGFYEAEKQFSGARLAEGESITGDCILTRDLKKGEHGIQVKDSSYAAIYFDEFDFTIK